ncbi:MAG: hypothetical protein U7126_24350 [Microcoleus sp.]
MPNICLLNRISPDAVRKFYEFEERSGDFVQKLMADLFDVLQSAANFSAKIKWPHRSRAVGRKDS